VGTWEVGEKRTRGERREMHPKMEEMRRQRDIRPET
jgi:hypothetical protein